MLTRNHRQEALSRAYVQIIASLCGLSFSTRETDYGIDLTLHEIQLREGRRSESGFGLDLQLKSTSVPNWSNDALLFDLPATNYNDLRDPAVNRRRLLVVFVLPKDEAEWATVTDDNLTLRHAAYWRSLAGEPATRSRKTVRVPIPRAHLFGPAALAGLVARAKRGEQP